MQNLFPLRGCCLTHVKAQSEHRAVRTALQIYGKTARSFLYHCKNKSPSDHQGNDNVHIVHRFWLVGDYDGTDGGNALALITGRRSTDPPMVVSKLSGRPKQMVFAIVLEKARYKDFKRLR